MAKSICDVSWNDAGFSPKAVGLAGAKFNNQKACTIEKQDGERNPEIPIFSPEGLKGAQEYVDTDFPGCKALSGGKADSIFNLYNVDCPNKSNE